jgi:putative transposase
MIAGIIPEPDGEWMNQIVRNQIVRNQTDSLDGFFVGYHDLIRDRSDLFTREFKKILESGGVKTVRLAVWSLNLNSFAERYVRTIKGECLDRMILIGERSLRRVVDQFCRHYHHERNHQGLGKQIMAPDFGSDGEGKVACRDRLIGLLRFYDGEAA